MTVRDEFAEDIPRDEPAEDIPRDEPPAQLFHPTLLDFVTGVIGPTYARNVDDGEYTWCPEWWKHTEAIARLDALWRAWEHLRLDPATGISVWFLMHADPHMAVLLDRTGGPFRGCTVKRGHRERAVPLPTADPPAGLFVP